jgi:hypothetical protein
MARHWVRTERRFHQQLRLNIRLNPLHPEPTQSLQTTLLHLFGFPLGQSSLLLSRPALCPL